MIFYRRDASYYLAKMICNDLPIERASDFHKLETELIENWVEIENPDVLFSCLKPVANIIQLVMEGRIVLEYHVFVDKNNRPIITRKLYESGCKAFHRYYTERAEKSKYQLSDDLEYSNSAKFEIKFIDGKPYAVFDDADDDDLPKFTPEEVLDFISCY